MGANVEMMKQLAAGADFFEIIFEAKFGLNFPPPYFSQRSLRRGGELAQIPLIVGNLKIITY